MPGRGSVRTSSRSFEREAKAISALDHPHICTLYDIGEAPNPANPESQSTNPDSVQYLVMQFLEGETLADRLARSPIAIDDALKFAAQIADALDAAHRRGIVHRDLKPGNVMLTRSGVKLLDFGLAKTAIRGSAIGGMTVAATRSAPLTAQGTFLGTLQYMHDGQSHHGRRGDARR